MNTAQKPLRFKELRIYILILLIVTASWSAIGDTPDPNATQDGLAEQWRYHDYEAIIAHHQSLASTGIAQSEVIGHSVESREIWAFKISDNPAEDEDEPAALVVSGVHAGEWIGPEMTYHLAKYLVEQYDHDPEVRHIVDNSEIWIVSVANPDGYIYAHTTDRGWRKNRRDNGDGTFGVDLNRNFAHNWGGIGASSLSLSDTYAGPGPFSEPETQAIRDLALAQQFDIYLDYHSPTQQILYPWGYTETPAPIRSLLSAIAGRMAGLIQDVHDTEYEPIQAVYLSPHSGTSFDWFHSEFGIPAFLVELPTPGFDATEEGTRPIVEENLPAALYYLSWAIGFGDVENLTSGQRYRQILPAIADANNGDEIVVGPGIYRENLTLEDKHLVLRSIDLQDPCVVADTVIQGYAKDAVVTLTGHHSSSTELVGLTLTEGTLDVFNRGSAPTLQNCKIVGTDMVAVQYYQGLAPRVIDCTIVGEIREVYRPSIAAHWALDEAEGSIAMDGFGDLHGDVFGDPIWQPDGGAIDGALGLDGIDDCVQTPEILSPASPFSVFLWIKGGDQGQVLLSQDSFSNWLLIDGQTGTLTTDIKPDGRGLGQTLTSSAVLTDDDWHRVGLAWDGSERRIYVDGVVVASEYRSAGLQDSLNGLNIGCGKDLELDTFWSGLIDDVRIFSEAIEP